MEVVLIGVGFMGVDLVGGHLPYKCLEQKLVAWSNSPSGSQKATLGSGPSSSRGGLSAEDSGRCSVVSSSV